MGLIAIFTRKLAAWRMYRQTVRELQSMTDHELSDIGISRYDIENIARHARAA